jgi:parallel beta-helix repeat protein
MALGRKWAVVPRLQPLEGRFAPATLFVDDDGRQRRNADFTAIQEAVDAAEPGDRIVVSPGTYTEQVTIGDGKDDIKLVSDRALRAVIEAPEELTGAPAIVHVDGAEGVSIVGFTITGPGETDGSLGYGVLIDGGGEATVSGNRITKIRSVPLGGTQTGVGIFVGGPDADAPNPFGTATIVGNVIDSYQKSGVVVLDPQSTATIALNLIAGAGPTTRIAQNGIQVSEGAEARIVGNLITGNIFTPQGTEAAGVLILDSGAVDVRNNAIVGNEVGVLVEGNDAGVFLTSNDVSRNSLDGISLTDSANASIRFNRVEQNGRHGIRLDNTIDSLIFSNRLSRNAGNGLSVTGDSSGNSVVDNTLRRNGPFDIFDETTGDGTAGSANEYSDNRFGNSNLDLDPDQDSGRGRGNDDDDDHGDGDGDD